MVNVSFTQEELTEVLAALLDRLKILRKTTNVDLNPSAALVEKATSKVRKGIKDPAGIFG